MPISTEIIRTLTIRGKTEGMPEATAALKGLGAATDAVAKSAIAGATASDTSAKRQLSLADAVANAERRFNSALRAQQDFEKIQRQMNAAIAQNPALQERANAVIALAAERFGQAGVAAKAFQAATSGVSGQLIALSAGSGPVGVFLSALGPWGLAAAVGLGAVSSAIHFIAEESARMGARAIDLRQFTDVTGLAIQDISALKKVGSEFGVTGDGLSSSFQRLTAQLTDARRASGALYDDVLTVNAGLAQELQQSTTTKAGIDALAKAYRAAGDDASRASLARAIFGRGGAGKGPILGAIADAGGIDALVVKMGGLTNVTKEQNDQWATMQARIEETNKRAKNILASIFTDEGLQASLFAAQALERMAIAAAKLSKEQSGLTFWQKFALNFNEGMAVNAGVVPDQAANDNVQSAARARAANEYTAMQKSVEAYSKALREGSEIDKQFLADLNKLSDAFGVAKSQAQEAADSFKRLQDNAAAQAKGASTSVSFLGSGATIDDRKNAQLKALTSSFLDNKTGVDNATQAWELFRRATDAVNADAVSQKLQGLNAVLGASAPVSMAVAIAEDRVNKARREGLDITPTAAKNATDLAYQTALGTLQMKASADAAVIEAGSLGRTVGAATEYTLVQTRIAEALRNKQPLTEADIARIKEEAKETGNLVQETEKLKIALDIKRGGELLFLDPVNVEIANKLKSIYPDIATALASGEAAAMRLQAAIKETRDLSADFAKTLVHGLIEGKSAADAFSAASKQLGVKLFDKSIDQLINAGGKLATQMIAGATESGSILTAAGLSSGAANAAGGAAAGSETAAGGVTGGTALAVGGQAAGLAIWGPIALLVGAIAALGIAAATASNAQERDRQTKAIQGYRDRAILAGTDTSTLQGQLTQFDINAARERAALPNGGLTPRSLTNTLTLGLFGDRGGQQTQESVELDRALAAERLRVISDFNAKAIEAEKKAEADRLAVIEDFGRALNEVKGQSFLNDVADLFKQIASYKTAGVGAGPLSEFLSLSAQQIVDSAKLTGDAFATLLTTFPELTGVVHEFGGSLEELAKAAKDAADAAAQRGQAYGDALFGILNDTTTLAGQLAAVDLQNQREREAELKAGGESLVQFEILAFARRQKVIEDFNAKAIEADKQAAQERLATINSTAKNIVDYVNGLLSGSGSTLSPTARLAAAQSTYNAQLTLAQAGNADAQAGITQLAENLRTAARDLFGSGAGYQAIFNQITSQLITLPTVQQATDPVVQAIRQAVLEQIAAIQATTDAVGDTTDAVGGTTNAVTLVRTAVQANDTVALANALIPKFNVLDTDVNGLLDLNEFVSGLHGMASDSALATMFKTLDADNSGSISRLDLINAAASATKSSVDSTKSAVDTNTSAVNTDTAVSQSSKAVLDLIKASNDTTANATSASNALLNAINAFSDSQVTLLTGIRSLNQQMADQATAGGYGNSVLTQMNQRLATMTEHLANISSHTSHMWVALGNGLSPSNIALAEGGWVTGGTPGRDSVPVMAMPGEFMVRESAARIWGPMLEDINAGRSPSLASNVVAFPSVPRSAGNDNGGVVAELRALREAVARLESEAKRNTRVAAAGFETVASQTARSAGAQEDMVREVKLAKKSA